MEDWLAVILSVVPTGVASAVFYFIGVRSGTKQAQAIIDTTVNKVAKVVVDAINADRRIDKADSGKVALRSDGNVGADLVVVAEQKKTMKVDAILVNEGKTPSVVAEKKLSHSTDSYLVKPEQKDQHSADK